MHSLPLLVLKQTLSLLGVWRASSLGLPLELWFSFCSFPCKPFGTSLKLSVRLSDLPREKYISRAEDTPLHIPKHWSQPVMKLCCGGLGFRNGIHWHIRPFNTDHKISGINCSLMWLFFCQHLLEIVYMLWLFLGTVVGDQNGSLPSHHRQLRWLQCSRSR